MEELLELSGGISFIFLLLTAFLGLAFFKFHWRWAKPKYHMITAVLTLIFALAHVLLVALD